MSSYALRIRFYTRVGVYELPMSYTSIDVCNNNEEDDNSTLSSTAVIESGFVRLRERERAEANASRVSNDSRYPSVDRHTV